MNFLRYCAAALLVIAIYALSPLIPRASAWAPQLSVSQSGGSLTLSISSADPNAQVQLSFVNPGTTLSSQVTSSYWYTNSNGSFTTSIDPNSYGIISGAYIYVSVNGQQSSQYQYNSGGYNSNYYSGGLSLSQTSVNLSVGQSQMITAYNNSGQLTVTGNTNPGVATASTLNNTITVYGSNTGTSTITVCSVYSGGQCGTLYITVGNSDGYGAINFSTNSVVLAAGQSQTVTVYGSYNYSSNYYVSSNTNPQIVTTSISSNAISLYGQSNGTSTITVCANNYNACGTILVTVTGTSTPGTVWFNPANPSLSVGQSLAVWINSSSTSDTYGQNYHSNYYYVSSNSNPNVVTASVSGTVLNLYGVQNGTSSVAICHTSLGYCGTLYIVVGGGTNYGNLSFSPSSPSLAVGQNMTVTVYNAYGNYYGSGLNILNNSNPNVVSASINSQNLNLRGNSSGNSTITVCQSNAVCGTMQVIVSGDGYNYFDSYNNNYGQHTNGLLINQNGTIYILYKNLATAFSNADAFLGLGYNFTSAGSYSYGYLQKSNYIVSSSNAAHPWGAWIKMGQTVYFVHESGLIPIPDWNTFLNNGGRQELIVNANSWDYQKPVLSIMTYNDNRLH